MDADLVSLNTMGPRQDGLSSQPIVADLFQGDSDVCAPGGPKKATEAFGTQGGCFLVCFISGMSLLLERCLKLFPGVFEEDILTKETSCKEGLWFPLGFNTLPSVTIFFTMGGCSIRERHLSETLCWQVSIGEAACSTGRGV